MALKNQIKEKCGTCGVTVARATNEGVAWNPSACTCPKPPGPQSPPRTIPWRSALLIGNDGKIRWSSHTIFLALEDDAWHPNTVHEIRIVKGLWYWLDETWGIGDNRGHRSMSEAERIQAMYAKEL